MTGDYAADSGRAYTSAKGRSSPPSGARGQFNTDAIRRDNPPDKVAERLGLDPKRVGKRLKCVCPGCGKKDKFDIHADDGMFSCFVCGPDMSGGDVIALVQRVMSTDFVGACKWLGGGEDIPPEEAARLEAERAAREEKQRAKDEAELREKGRRMRNILGGCQKMIGGPVESYLTGRGLEPALSALGWLGGDGPDDVRYHHSLPAGVDVDGKWTQLGEFPAMVAAFAIAPEKLSVCTAHF